MDNFGYWLLIGPLVLIAVLYVLGFFTAGAIVAGGARRARPRQKSVFLVLGLLIAVAPWLHLKWMDARELARAEARLNRLAELERIDLKGRIPDRILVSGRSASPLLMKAAARYGLRPYAEDEAARLSAAYGRYRANEYCLRTDPDAMIPGTAIRRCKPLESSIQEALELREPILVFAHDNSTSYRQSNTYVGAMYELRLITAREDRLVDYYEELSVNAPFSPIRPFGSGWRKATNERPMRPEDFLIRALERDR